MVGEVGIDRGGVLRYFYWSSLLEYYLILFNNYVRICMYVNMCKDIY